ncbi:hypothetical protein GCM10025794_27390 [Massilia kyonggiensis]
MGLGRPYNSIEMHGDMGSGWYRPYPWLRLKSLSYTPAAHCILAFYKPFEYA